MTIPKEFDPTQAYGGDIEFCLTDPKMASAAKETLLDQIAGIVPKEYFTQVVLEEVRSKDLGKPTRIRWRYTPDFGPCKDGGL